VPEFASSLLVPRAMGMRRASEKLLLGDPIGAEQALETGFVNAVLPPAEVLPHARRMAARFVQLPPSAVRETKRLMRSHDRDAVRAAMREEGRVFAERLRSPEAQEAFQAFFQKRKPDFSKF
jgi:enoyl-CoA hydratase/carnithine racemase